MISAPLIEYLKKGIFTVLGLMLAVYLFVILLTYTGNDPSWSHISSDMTTINNMGGAMGAWLSDLLYSFFGFGAWCLLAYFVYESVLIWWETKPTFWLLRIIAYVFLILSASALFAQMAALWQHIADPATTPLEGVAGGIIGLELQIRLAQLLTQWGSVLFLTFFVIITATFAFNIHWLALYDRITDLSWLGSGLQTDDDYLDEEYNQTAKASGKTGAKKKKDGSAAPANSDEPDYGQLPLELQPAYQTAATADSSARFGNALTDFLSKSGLKASIKSAVAAEDEAAMAASHPAKSTVKAEPVTPEPAAPQAATSTATKPVQAPAQKVEPSFAWNDASTVDSLLASEQHPDTYRPDPVVPAASKAANTDFINEVLHRNDTSDAPSRDDIDTADINELADAWLAENHSVAEDHAADSLSSVSTMAADEATIDTDDNDDTDKIDGTDDIDNTEHQRPATKKSRVNIAAYDNKVPDAAPADATEDTIDTPVASTRPARRITLPSETEIETKTESEPKTAALPEDDWPSMTPTNTPPTNPKAAPSVSVATSRDQINDAQSEHSDQQTEIRKQPTMSFAVPEGDASNHIADMMPEDDAPIMPDIHDDAAFSSRSRAMQTAAYRAKLTPIPELSILDTPDPDRKPSYTVAELEQLSELLEIKLQEFNVKAQVVNAIPGPVVTRFEVELAAGVKASKVTGISRDLARSLSMASLRVVEVIPGKPYIGIEVPNKKREMVRLIELLNTDTYKDPKAQISMAMGKDIGGKPIITDLARAPHMLVAGTTGSGKSVLVNAMLLSMLLKYTPNELRLILIDPKQLELANYNDIPHLLTPVVTDMTEAASSLSWCVAEMERRYQLMSLLKVRKLNEFNKKVRAAEKAGKPMIDPLWRPNDSVSIDQAPKLKTLPMIVIVADEFADMIMQVGKQAEELITRLAQKSRAAGIHLMLATQRPSVDVITGLIKANIPVRAALRVNSKVDSRTILDSGGAEDMLGNGDMLFLGPGQIEPDRVHGAYVSDEEVNRVCDAWRERGAPDYIDNMAGNFELTSPGGGNTANASGEDDDLYNDAVAFIMETRKVSASSIQRKFSIGYNRAARIVDSMEEAGLVSSMGKSGKRELLV